MEHAGASAGVRTFGQNFETRLQSPMITELAARPVAKRSLQQADGVVRAQRTQALRGSGGGNPHESEGAIGSGVTGI